MGQSGADWLAAYARCFGAHPDMAAAGGPIRPAWETPPPTWLLDLADQHSLGVLVGLPWTEHVCFLDDTRVMQTIRTQVAEDVEPLKDHPAVVACLIGIAASGMKPPRYGQFAGFAVSSALEDSLTLLAIALVGASLL